MQLIHDKARPERTAGKALSHGYRALGLSRHHSYAPPTWPLSACDRALSANQANHPYLLLSVGILLRFTRSKAHAAYAGWPIRHVARPRGSCDELGSLRVHQLVTPLKVRPTSTACVVAACPNAEYPLAIASSPVAGPGIRAFMHSVSHHDIEVWSINVITRLPLSGGTSH